MNLFEELEFVKDIIRKAGDILLELYDNTTGIRVKGDGSLVSDSDKKVSTYLLRELTKSFPEYAILDEESKEDGQRFIKEYCWFIDPLDGTREYLEKRNNFGVLMGLAKNFQPILGVTYKPQTDELVYAVRGYGAYIESRGIKRKIRVDTSPETRIIVSNSRTSEELEEMIERIDPTSKENMGGSLKTVEVARGNATLFLCPTTSIMHLWDLCAPSIILEEAGGRITDIYGGKFDYSMGQTANRNGVVASNGIIHDDVLKRIRTC